MAAWFRTGVAASTPRTPGYARRHDLPAGPRRILRFGLALLAVPAASACGNDGAGPSGPRVQVVVASGDRQYGAPGATLQEPLRVVVIDARPQAPVEEIRVAWRIVEGTGASLSAATSTSDEEGIASTTLRLGSQTGTVRVEARAESMIGEPAEFLAFAVQPPAIAEVSPSQAAAGETVTITGSGFSPDADQNAVLFGGLRGRVLAATPTSLTVQVPACVPTRALELRVNLGAVPSAPVSFRTVAAGGAALQLARGAARLFTDPADLACIRLPEVAGQGYLLVPQNAAEAPGVPMPFELRLIADGGLVTSPDVSAQAPVRTDRASDWELRLRLRERELGRGAPDALIRPEAAAVAIQPQLGQSREFNVLTSDNETVQVTAEVVAMSQHAIMYQDVDAPANGVTAADFEAFGRIFDDPIYPTDVEVFGSPSDVDGNDRIIILFTPRVNALTPASDESFIAGYFYGCDLVEESRCAQTNRAELFYSMVPDPDGRFSGRRTKTQVLRTVPGVLAHEFQHMISFASKNESLDVLWLSEGLAHSAENLVGNAFFARGDSANGFDFKIPNYVRANRYLAAVSNTSLLSAASPGTLELRGAAWLFVEHIAGHYGAADLLGRLTRSARTGTMNVTVETGRPWRQLFSDFTVALWADGAPELQGVSIDPRLTFAGLDLRRDLARAQQGGTFPLRPPVRGYADFLASDQLPPASADYFIAQQSIPAPPALGIAFTGMFGGAFTGLNAAGQITILRIR